MSALNVRELHKRPQRTVEADGEGEWATWHVTVRADFKARLFRDLTSGDVDRMLTAFYSIVVSHNFTDEDGDPVNDLDDVDYRGLLHMVGRAMDAVGKLPPR